MRSPRLRLAPLVAALACSTNNSGSPTSTEPSTTSSTESTTTAGLVGTTPSVNPIATQLPGATEVATEATPSATLSETTISTDTDESRTTSSAMTDAVSAGDVTSDATPVVSAGSLGSEADVDVSTGAGTGADTVDENGDPVPPRALNVTAMPGRHEHRFRAKTADPAVSYNDNDQIAIFDNRAATLMGKLVLTFGGAGETKGNLTGGGEFAARRGFHVLALAAFQAYNIVDYGPDFFGLARRTVFEGVMHTKQDAFANITLTPADGVAQRTQKALQYLHAAYPEEDWGYFLQADGSVRWSDVIFTGVSHGASNSARFASLVRVSRVVAVAGPRDNLCARADVNDCGGEVATWYDEEPQTPLDRYYALTGVTDDQHTQHLFAMAKLGLPGEPTRVDNAQPPYGNSHRLVHGGGHDDVCGNPGFQNLCNYAFGVPTENHAGTQ